MSVGLSASHPSSALTGLAHPDPKDLSITDEEKELMRLAANQLADATLSAIEKGNIAVLAETSTPHKKGVLKKRGADLCCGKKGIVVQINSY